MRSRHAERAAFVLLCVLLLVLPNLEAPKTVAWALFVLCSLGVVFRVGEDPVGWHALGTSLVALVAASGISTAVNWPLQNGVKGIFDTVMYSLVCWCVYRGRWTAARRRVLITAIAVGVLAGLARAVWEVSTGRLSQLEFHSAGVVTQSSIYLGVALVAVLGMLVARDSATPRSAWAVGWWLIAGCVMLAGLGLMASRGAILAFGVAWLLILFIVRRPSVVIASLVVMAVVTVCVAFAPAGLDRRLSYKIEQLPGMLYGNHNDRIRAAMWRIGVARLAQGDAWWVGIGPRNFSSIDPHTVGVDIAGLGRLNHAHNLFLNKAVEEGLIGLGAFIAFFAVVSRLMAREWRRRGGQVDGVWFGAVGALVVPAVAGSFNTPWYQEHALLAAILIGLALSPRSTHDAPGGRSDPSRFSARMDAHQVPVEVG